MPVPDPRAYLDLIGRRCEQAASLLAGMTLEEFLNDTDAQDPRLRMEPRHRRSGPPDDDQVPRLQAPDNRPQVAHRVSQRDVPPGCSRGTGQNCGTTYRTEYRFCGKKLLP